jgi:hypothetical protein
VAAKAEMEYAIQIHKAWKARFRNFTYGKVGFDLDVVGQADACNLGKWLGKEGQRWLTPPDMERICKQHDEFHRLAASIVAKIRGRDYAGAREDLLPDGPFDQVSDGLVDLLDRTKFHNLPENIAATERTDEAAPSVPPETPEPSQSDPDSSL